MQMVIALLKSHVYCVFFSLSVLCSVPFKRVIYLPYIVLRITWPEIQSAALVIKSIKSYQTIESVC